MNWSAALAERSGELALAAELDVFLCFQPRHCEQVIQKIQPVAASQPAKVGQGLRNEGGRFIGAPLPGRLFVLRASSPG